MSKLLFLISTLFLFSCSSLKTNLNREYIEFNHHNVMVIKNDRINIKLIPNYSKKGKNVKVKILYQGKKLEDKTITFSDYDEIKNKVKNIDREDLVMPRIINKGKSNEHLVGISDGGQNSILLYENNSKVLYSTTGFNQDYHKSFYSAVEKIFNTLNIKLTSL
ncbi:hypothetical protein [Amniculibacterium sp. G2-70]|uniref:hypothetical protein n=1 Tax=Amniculibacterium sp. G2-70 TaxID=2767188 RepID=UPI001654B777|nr:hypothetical protein [Amniculibacterium sp. G2-70]